LHHSLSLVSQHRWSMESNPYNQAPPKLPWTSDAKARNTTQPNAHQHPHKVDRRQIVALPHSNNPIDGGAKPSPCSSNNAAHIILRLGSHYSHKEYSQEYIIKNQKL
jgi:hypothetical protein